MLWENDRKNIRGLRSLRAKNLHVVWSQLKPHPDNALSISLLLLSVLEKLMFASS